MALESPAVPVNQLSEVGKILEAADVDNLQQTSGGEAPDPGENELFTEDEDYEPRLGEEDPIEEKGEGLGDEVEAEVAADSINTITDLANELEVDPEVFYNLEVPLRDGLEPVTLAEMKDAYQESLRGGATTEETAAVQAENQELKARLAQATQQAPQQHAALTEIDTQLASLQQQYQNVDWARFESENPAEAVLQKQKFGEAFSELQGKRENMAQGLARQQAQAVQEYEQTQWGIARQNIDGWNDDATLQADLKEMGTTLGSYGFKPEEIRQISDARLLKFINDAVKTKAKLDAPLPNKRPKSGSAGRLRAGSLRTKPDAGKKRAALIEKGKQTKNPRGKASVISKLLDGG
jgi:hypothetical protein